MFSKYILAAIDLGLGEHQINGLLSILNIPTVSHCMIDNRIREVGDVIESVADQSMEEWTEKEMTRESDGNDNVTVSVDAAWQRRGSGRSYDSLTGKPFYPDLDNQSSSTFEVREGVCYQSNTMIDTVTEDSDEKILEIPAPKNKPVENDSKPDISTMTHIYFDIEATGLGKSKS
ncbi:unnamed protein product [Mytilus edulis]|uniref:Mutator-like transposase domain-containing protein n=1 Tax=Mytilus edulis TaxID=6550 RepID=A0A8S3S045_MYTED|nr:unnamed protein product [Mytilus edulis]